MPDQYIENIRSRAREELAEAGTVQHVEAVRVKYLGKKGLITQRLRSMAAVPPPMRAEIGRQANVAKSEIEAAVAERLAAVEQAARRTRLTTDRIDLTLPGRRVVPGARHPLSLVLDEIIDVFVGLGFAVADGPEVESDYYNFEALNIPKDHPARDMQDTFYVSEDVLLRTHTSPVQIRTMLRQQPPVRIIVPGRVYRRDALDQTHSPVFHQVEGLAVDRDISMGDLRGTLELFARELFGPDSRIRFRPSFFPFTEPSAEVDVLCFGCKGAGCRICKASGWLEILGSGMVHPQVLRTVGYDPEAVTGWAFGMGVERVAMLRYGIDDIRLFYENDVRFLSQFS